jgi:hypothetical protein
MFDANCQPTSIRLNTSITKLKYKTPSQQRKYVKSATHNLIRVLGGEVAADQIRAAQRLRIGRGGLPWLAAALGALDPVLGHQPLHLTTRHVLAGARQRLPHPPIPVRGIVGLVRVLNHCEQPLVLDHAL